MNERAARAEARRQTWSGGLVSAGSQKPQLYEELSVVDRWAALTELCRRSWQTAGLLPLPPLPRAEWPGEIFEIRRDE